jgi:hypothetical protein
MATTTNYSWSTPDDTALVKDGALAIRTLGSSVDTTVKNLNPETTTGAISYRGITANQKTALPIGTAGQVLTVNSGATAPEWKDAPAVTPAKNFIINGGFNVAQRGTSFTSTSNLNNDDAYTLDRWYILSDGNDTIDVTRETSVIPTDGQYAIALDVETVNKKFGIAQIVEYENCLGLLNKNVTFSFKAKVSSTTKLDNVKAAIIAWSGTADAVTSDIISAWNGEGSNPTLIANATYENTPANLNLTTSYATYSVTANIDTASTKNVILFIWSDVSDTTLGDFLYIAESKLEIGSTATAFQYAGGTPEGELTACQRYFQVIGGNINDENMGTGQVYSTVNAVIHLDWKVTFRSAPTVSIGSGGAAGDFTMYNATGTALTVTSILSTDSINRNSARTIPTVASGLVAGSATIFRSSNSNGRYFISAEL